MNTLRWYLNDLSLEGQFDTAAGFVEAIGELASLRGRLPGLEARLYCTRALGERLATGEQSCRNAIMSAAARDAKSVILRWIGKFGPFLDDDRLEEEDDYFEFEGHDVTDQGLGEAARRVRIEQQAGVFSFLGGELNFERTPLTIQHGLAEQPLGHIEVDNVWTVADLEVRVRGETPEPRTWGELVEASRARFDRLLIPGSVLERLNRETFYPHVADRALVLLDVLNRIMEGRADDGSMNPDMLALWQEHTRGEKALFSDESDANKRAFQNEMTFPDPEDSSRTLFCPWHGKIKTPQFRIHFEWPPPPGQQRLKVLYIGPKITKR